MVGGASPLNTGQHWVAYDQTRSALPVHGTILWNKKKTLVKTSLQAVQFSHAWAGSAS